MDNNLVFLLEHADEVTSFKLILDRLKEEELLMTFNGNHLIELHTDEGKKYIPLFTDKDQIKEDMEYTRLDKVKLDVVIRDIYSLGYYHAISINAYTHDFIMNKDLIEFYNNMR